MSVAASTPVTQSLPPAGLAVPVEASLVAGELARLEDDGFPVMPQLALRLQHSRAKTSKVIGVLEPHFLDEDRGETELAA